jgi:uncharacterized protein DUF4386
MWHQGESRIQAFSRAQQEAAESRRSQCSQKSDLTAPGNFLEGVEEFTASLRNPTTVQMPVRVPCLYLGAAFLAILAIRDRLIVENNAAETARNILAHERLFRIGIAGDLIYCAGVVVLLTALYVILRPVNRGLGEQTVQRYDHVDMSGDTSITSMNINNSLIPQLLLLQRLANQSRFNSHS